MRSLALTLPMFLLVAATNPDEAALEDARCLLAIGQLIGSEDQAVQLAGQLGSQYYFGRLDGRNVADLEGLLKQASTTMKPEEMEATIQRCGAVMQERGQALQTIGERLNSSPPAE